MPYIKEDGGRLNNFAVEPKMYTAEPPTNNEKLNYTIMGVAGALLVIGLCVAAFILSSGSQSI